TGRNGLPCDTTHWSVEDDARSLWLYMACGLVRIESTEWNAWAAAVDLGQGGNRTIMPTVFDTSDGVRSLPDAGTFSPQVAKSSDGRLWFLPWDGVSVVDPPHLRVTAHPPPVQVEQVTADRNAYDAPSDVRTPLRLPPLVRDLQIDYTALSLAAPERVRF